MPSRYHDPFRYFPKLREYKKTFDCLKLTDGEVGGLYKRFKSIDVDDSGNIDIAEVLAHLHIEKTFFNKRVFGLLDTDASGELNFEEFVVGLWNYCSVEDGFFEHFAFDLYDTDNSGHIDITEAQYMIKDIYGEEFEHNAFAKKAHQKLAQLDTSTIDFQTFHNFSINHKAMLYPAFALQLGLRKYIMGNSFWHKQAVNRLKMSGGKYKSVIEIIERKDFHSKRKLHKRDSELGILFRRGSMKKNNNDSNSQGMFSAPGAAFVYGSKGFAEDIACLSRSNSSEYQGHEKRRGSKTNCGQDGRRGSKTKHDHDRRRGSKTSHDHDSPQNKNTIEKAGARRNSKVATTNDDSVAQNNDNSGVGSNNKSPEKEKNGERRGSQQHTKDKSGIHQVAGNRRGSKNSSVAPIDAALVN